MDRSSSLLAGGPARIEVTGALTPLVGEFRKGLTGRGFTRYAVAQHTHLMAHLSVWLSAEGLAPDQLVADGVNAFLVDRRAARHWFLTSRRGLEPWLQFLYDRGVILPLAAPRPAGPVEELLAEYRLYLVTERGLAPLSVLRYLGPARLFLAALSSPLPVALQELSAAEVTRFLLVEVRRRRTWSAKSLVTALRSLLRFLHVAGHVPVGLAAAVPAVAGWGLASLPRGIGVELVTAMLTGCDRSCAMGRRDYAILLVLARLGLRNGAR